MEQTQSPKDLSTSCPQTCQQPKTFSGEGKRKRLTTEAKAAIVTEYKSGNYSYRQLSEKYGVTSNSIQKYCKGVDKCACRNELEQLGDQKIRDKIIKNLEDIQVDSQFIAGKIKRLLNSEDNGDIIKVLQLMLKLYQIDKPTDTEHNVTIAQQISTYLPENQRLAAIE